MPARILQRIGPLAGLSDLLHVYGVALDDVARRSGISLELESLAPDDVLPLELALLLLDNAVVMTGDELLPVKLGERYRLHHHGMIHPYLAAAPTLGRALLDICELQRLYANGTVIYLHRLGDDYALGFGVYAGVQHAGRHLYSMCAKVGQNFIFDLTGGAAQPLEIMFPFAEPHNQSGFRQGWTQPLYFNQNQCCLVLPARLLAMELPGANPGLRASMLETLMQKSVLAMGYSDRVRRMVRPQLLVEDPSMEGMAALLNVHPRTLRRALAAEGTSFETIRDEVRNHIAKEMLATTQLSIGEVSAIIAFASHAAFVRAFQRWNGVTPSTWRIERSA
jgi:AraC-like DNA-binding protein